MSAGCCELQTSKTNSFQKTASTNCTSVSDSLTLGLEAQSNSCGLLASLPQLSLVSSQSNSSLIHTGQPFTQYLVQAQKQVPVVVAKHQGVTLILNYVSYTS